MARLVRELGTEVFAGERRFKFVVRDDLDEWQGRGRLEPDEGAVLVHSAGDHHYPAVRLEAWDAEPEPPDPSWQEVGSAMIESPTGIIRLPRGFEEPDALFLIGPPIFEYRVAAYTKDAHLLPAEGRSVPRGAEKWLLRFWPLRDAFDPRVHLRPPPYSPDGTSIGDPGPAPVSQAAEWPAMRTPEWPVWSEDTEEDRVAQELNPAKAQTTGSLADRFTPALCAEPGTTVRVWQWDDADHEGPLGAMAAHREILAHDVIERRVFVTAIVTVLRNVGDWYDLRPAEPVEAARLLYAERAWGVPVAPSGPPAPSIPV
ncbi:hypothetical protein [Spongiactinospora sp. TRM90649]|uniref:hypothetical protein n=1 Tax=Spongiactinospora sp. TRM90649 TaxID=3031114 RepID=UPI0023F88A16|nr:hypothetical protein [Spongiactinospora sp. TRM90649]MDF5753622.1 hypothetical protein [Spongiactinospora sp. TRM90649]